MTSDFSKSIPSLPKETARAANAIFGRSNFYIQVGEHLEAILEGVHLPCSSDGDGETRKELTISALITFFQFIEGLTDVQAIDAVRTRTDWKFALHLSLVPGIFRESTLCEFRHRILLASICQDQIQRMIDQLVTFVQPTHSSLHDLNVLEVVSLVCSLNRLDRAQQAMNQVLEILAVRFPDWLRKIALPHWYGRYNRTTPRLEVATLLGQQRFLTEKIGADMQHLLEKIHQSGLSELNDLDEVKRLHGIWSQQFKAPDGSLIYWPEKLTLKDCMACAYRGAGRQH